MSRKSHIEGGQKWRVLVADDHPIMRRGVRQLLEEGGHTVVGEATNGHEAVRMARDLRPDIAILDVAMPRLNGLEAAREIRRMLPSTRTILLTMHESREYVLGALKAGAKGYVLKVQASDDLLHAVHEVSQGHVYLSAGVAPVLVEACLSDTRIAVDPLTARERQILQLIAEGHTTKEVARLLSISLKTAEAHRSHIMRKLDIHEVAGLTRYAIHRGLVGVTGPTSDSQG